MDEQEEFEFRYRYEQEQKQTGAVKAPSSTGGRLYGSSYDKYLAEMQERASRPSIPGAEAYDKAKPMSYEEWAKLKDKKHGDRLLSLPDVAMTIGSAPFAAVNAVGGALANKLTGQEDFLPAYERIFNQTMWQPKTDTGEDILNALNPVLGAFPAVGGYVGPLGAMRKAKAKPIPQSKDFAAALQEEAPKSEPVVEAPDLRLEHPIAAENRVAAQNKAVRGADDWNSMEHAARAVDEEIAAMEQLQRQQAEEALAAEQARTHAFLRDAQQTVIDDTPHGDRPAQFGMTDEFGRVDEGVPGIERDATGQMRVVQGSGIPIRADLSIEAQNLQDPLQMNLWGDELSGRSQDGSIGMTQALDRMPPGAAREQAVSQLSGVPVKDLASKVSTVLQEGPQGLSRTQLGAIDTRALKWRDAVEKDISHLNPKWTGMSIKWQPSPYGPEVAILKDGNEVGSLTTQVQGDNLTVGRVAVNPEFRGTGLAKLMYEAVSTLGGDIVRSSNQLPDGKAMWDHFEQTGYGPAGKIPFKGMSRGQRGALNFEAVLQKLKGRKQLPSVEDLSIGTPPKAIAPEEAAHLNFVADKAAAVGMNQYSRISTPEQVMVNPGKDIRPSYTGGRNATVSGVEGMVRLYPQNKLLNFVRTTFQEARNQAEIWSKDFLTGKEGINSHLNKLTQEQKNEVVGLLLEADRQQRPISDTALEKLGFTPEQSLAVKRIRDALDHLYAEKTKALGAQGFDAHTYREGYVPANFGGAYKSLVGHYKDGKWITTGIAQADTLYGLKKAEEWYRQQDGSVEIIRAGTSKLGTGRTGLKQSSGLGRSNDAWANLIAALAKVDPEFAKAKAMADQKGIDATASLYDFQVHELHKKGVTGALGNRPWLDKNTNTKQFIEGLVQYLEDGYRYTAYQKPLTDTMTLISNPELRKTQKNAARYTEQYLEHLKGQGLSPIGAGLNSAVDAIVSGLGLGHGKMQKVAHEISHYSALHMMGFANIGFLGMQLTQLATGGMPEASSIVSQHGLPPSAMPKALNNTMNFLVKLGLDRKMGKSQDLPAHMVEAFDWADSVGMFTFSESELAHQVLQSKLRKKSDKILDASIRYGELATRPTVFLWYADLFNQAGFTGKEALLKAQAATDYAMVNYHPDERPMLYQSLGVMGSLLGALSTYKHNFVTQGITRSKHAVTEPAAFGTFMALGLAMYGLGGFPGYEEVDNKVNEYSGKSIRQWVLDNPQQPSVAMDGWLSAASGLDFQSRLSMSSLFPDSPASMFPHISNISNIFMKGMEFAINPDTGSFQDLALAGAPKSIANALEMSVFEDGNIRLRKTGENKYTTPRTKEEEMVRAITGIKPFRETLEDKSVFQARVVESRRQDKLKAAQQRFDRAFLLDDPAGMDKAAAAYEEHSGDLTTLFDSGRLAKLVEESSKGERARRAGTPSSLNSLKTYETFMGNK